MKIIKSFIKHPATIGISGCLVVMFCLAFAGAYLDQESRAAQKRVRLQVITQPSADVPVAHDSFTASDGTALENHALDTGQPWLRVPYSSSGQLLIAGNHVVHGPVKFRSIYLAGASLSADQYASATVTFRDGATPTIVVRADRQNERYIGATYDSSQQAWEVFANEGYDGDTAKLYPLGTWPDTIVAGESRTIRLQVVDDEVRFYVNGTERVSAETYYVSAIGYAGIGLSGSSSAFGTGIDDFATGNVSSASPTPTPTPTPIASPSPSPSPGPCTTWHLTTDTPARKVFDCY